MKFFSILVPIISITFQTFTSEISSKYYPDFQKFVLYHAPPHEIKDLIEKNKDIIVNKHFGTIKEIPGIFLKDDDFNRVINAERMTQCINKYKLNLLGVAKKYVYPVNGKYRVFAETIHSSRGTSISLELIQQLAKLTEETGFRDWDTNWMYSNNGKLICIDTENNSFVIGAHRSNDLLQNCKAQYLISLMCWKAAMTKEAYEWLISRINSLLKNSEGKMEYPTIIYNTKFDDPKINITNVKKYIELLNKKHRINSKL